MSWFQDLAGKAENILNKIDQNAATVLQVPKAEGDDVDGLQEVTCESSNNVKSAVIPRVPSKGYLSLSRPSTPKKNTVVNLDEKINLLLNDGSSSKSETQKKSDLSSRRSSLNSSKDNTVIEKDIQDPNTLFKPNISVEKELEATKIVLSEIKLERDDLKNELESLMEQQNNNKNRNRIVELEELCNLLVEEKNILSQKTITMEDSNSKYIKSISELESTISKHHQNEIELQQKLEWAKNEANQAVSELHQYRSRAQTTLQIKEKLITELKSGREISSENLSISSSNEDILNIEIEQLKSEKQNLLQEVNSLNDKYEQSRNYISSLEKHHKEINCELEVKINKMEETINQETSKSINLENDLKVQNQEMNSLREEISKIRSNYTAKLQEKESELQRFKNRASQRSGNNSNDFEERINSLTQSLVQKQNSLESITVERNALRMQLEKLDNQHKTTILQIRQQRNHLMSVNETDDAKSQVPEFLVESPFDHKLTRRVKRAYSSLDGVGIRLGVFLRRYPLVRIMVIFYIAILHIWVMFVLLSSTPN